MCRNAFVGLNSPKYFWINGYVASWYGYRFPAAFRVRHGDTWMHFTLTYSPHCIVDDGLVRGPDRYPSMTGWNVLVTPVIRPYDRCHIVLCDNSKACG